MSGFTAAGIKFDTVTNESKVGADDASQLAPLGFELTVPNGDFGFQTWVYVKNVDDSGAAPGNTLTKGLAVMTLDASPTSLAKPYEVQLCTKVRHSAVKVVGVAQHDILHNGYGFVLKSGKGVYESGAAVSAGATLMTDPTTTAAHIIALDATGGNTDCGIGVALVAASGAGEFPDAIFSCGV